MALPKVSSKEEGMKQGRLLGCVSLLLIAGAAWAQGTFRTSFQATCLEPGTVHTTCGRRLDETVMQGLAHLKWTGDGVQPLLAESWDTEDGGRAFVFHLRQGVTWHDGEPFTADDVVFSYNLYANPEVASTYATKLAPVAGYDAFQSGEADSLTGVTKVDENTVRVEMSEPSPLWVELQQISLSILPVHLLGDVPATEINGHAFWTERVGTGPFIWDNYQPNQFVQVVKNPDYFLGEPKLERIVYQIYDEIPTIMNALEAGEVDMMKYEGGGIPISELERFQALDQLVTLPVDAGLPTFITFNHEDPRFQDKRVRQAFLYAIDREAIVEALLYGAPEVANTMFPAEWARPDDLNDYAYDPEMARTLLEEAGWSSSEPITFTYYYPDDVYANVVVTIQQYLSEVGINIEPRLVDSATLSAMRDDGSFELGLFANGQGLDPSVGSIITACEGGFFTLGYCNEGVDELMAEGLTKATQEERQPIYYEISRILNEELPKAWLWYDVRVLAFNKRVQGLAEHFEEQPLLFFDVPVYNEVETWSVTEGQ